MVTIKWINNITLEVHLSDGTTLNARDFIGNPKQGHGVEMLDDIGYRCVPIGDDTECTTCGLDNI